MHGEMRRDIGVPMDVGREAKMSFPRPDGREIAAETDVASVLWDGADMMLATLNDVAGRKSTEQAIRNDAALATAIARACPSSFDCASLCLKRTQTRPQKRLSKQAGRPWPTYTSLPTRRGRQNRLIL